MRKKDILNGKSSLLDIHINKREKTMNKKIFAATAVLAAVTMSFGLDTWVGANSEYRIETGFDDGTDTFGYWYDYNDANDGGSSTITWPVAKGNEYDDNALDPIIDHCKGLCATVSLGAGFNYPFVGVGFNVSGGDQKGEDVSSWGGICIGYKSTGIAPALEISPEDEGTVTEYNNYKAALKIAATPTVVNLAWSDFKQEAGWGKKVNQSEILAKTAAVKFKMAGKAGATTEFNITTIGEYGKCDGSAAIQSVKAASALKASVAGRTLSLSGVKAGATVEILNLQGQVMLKSVLNSANASLYLANMDAGIYMVRVAGQANLSQKIVLK